MCDLLSLPLHRLERPVKIHSSALDADIWVVPSECAGEQFDAPVYSFEECRILLALNPSPEQLRAIHLVKCMLEGDLILPENLDQLRRLYQDLQETYQQTAQELNQGAAGASEDELLRLARQLGYLSKNLDGGDSERHDLS